MTTPAPPPVAADRRTRLPPPAVDALIAAAAVVAAVAALARPPGPPVTTGTVAVVAVLAAPLAWRRRSPAAVFWAVALLQGGYNVVEAAGVSVPDTDTPWLAIAPAVALYTVAAEGTRRQALTAGAATLALFLLAGSVLGTPGRGAAAGLLGGLPYVVPFALAWALGDANRVRRATAAGLAERAALADDRAALLAERAERLQAEQELRARRATLEERARIARELHDVAAHHLSLLMVQVEGARARARLTGHTEPNALDAAAASGRAAMTELHRLLGVLREDPDAGDVDLAPQPGLNRLGALLAEARAAGQPVELRTCGEPRSLPPGIDVSAYRIVQEALSNVRKHARDADGELAGAAVTVTWDHDQLRLSINDDGLAPADPPGPAGHGMIGLRERTALLGGTLRTGPGKDGGWLVEACLPLPQRAGASARAHVP
jgi:signal transduction histidine kinase